jgi:hypothetical protein
MNQEPVRRYYDADGNEVQVFGGLLDQERLVYIAPLKPEGRLRRRLRSPLSWWLSWGWPKPGEALSGL